MTALTEYLGIEDVEFHALNARQNLIIRADVERPMWHVVYPHDAGYLLDCAACEQGRCRCLPGQAECLSQTHNYYL